MKPVAFLADNANAALAQIHEQLGPDAVVVSVRKLPADGIARLWQNGGKVEVTACVPEKPPEPVKKVPAKEEIADAPFVEKIKPEPLAKQKTARRWRSIAWLETKGLLPTFADELEYIVRALHGEEPPPLPLAEWSAVRETLAACWRPARPVMTGTGRPHVFIGPAGSGKTTALCKWMTAAVLMEERRVHVWRLDGESANAAEFLTLHCEMMGVPVNRFWQEPAEPADLRFVDLPGVEIQDAKALAALRAQLASLPQPHVHLVLNAAYENAILFDQFDAFEAFAPEDVIFTHLDEERRRVKLWNFVLGTKCPLSFLSAGQKIPGEFRRADPALLLPQKKSPVNTGVLR